MSQATSIGDGSSGGNSGVSGGREAGGQHGGGGGGRSALISDLVAQLKRGDISKTELFSRLQQLQGPASAKAGTATSGSCAGGADGAPANLPAGNAITAVGSTASSGASSVVAAGTTAAESAGFFSAYDRQVGVLVYSLAFAPSYQRYRRPSFKCVYRWMMPHLL